VAAQDPDEPFDLCDRDGTLLGQVKSRRAVHRDGDWHRALHLWVILRGERGPRVVLQRRSLAKDTHPGLVDVSVAGHLRAGETEREALREAEEEIGLAVSLEETVPLGHRRIEKVVPGGVDREVQTVLATVSDREFARLRPHLEEVAALYAPSLADAMALEAGERAVIDVESLDLDGRLGTASLRAGDMVPGDGAYRRRCLAWLAAHLRGETLPPMRLE
jgi:isopentenyldiphosphate isomerase